MNGADHRWDMFNTADRLVDYGLWPKAWSGALILGRRRVATMPQAMVSMAVGQKEIFQWPHSMNHSASSQRHLGVHTSTFSTPTPTALNTIAQGQQARAPRVPAPPWVTPAQSMATSEKQHIPKCSAESQQGQCLNEWCGSPLGHV